MNNAPGRLRSIALILGAGLFWLYLIPPDANSSDWRCREKIISVGDRKSDVLRNCGQPANVEVRQEERIKRDLGSAFAPPEETRRPPLFLREFVTIEEWEYNLGPTQFIRYLTFENGILVRIATGDYGY